MIWGATCTHTAAHAFRKSMSNCIVNVFSVDWASKRKNSHVTPGDWHFGEPMKSAFEVPFGWYPQIVYFATFANRHMHDYGTTQEQLAEIPIAFRRHANGHHGAIMKNREISVDSYLSQPMLAFPFRKEDCCLISDGAAAFVMKPTVSAYDGPNPPIIVEGVGRGKIAGAPYISQQRDITSTPQAFSAPWALAMAEKDVKEIDLIAVYDCFSMTALMQIEDMGFCSKGEGGSFISNQRLHFDNPRKKGGIPCNTHGGLLSHAYVLGIAHIIELIRQLRGQADNQVEDAEIAAYAGFTADEASTLILRRN
jgi:acetyl-CoA acetyltransferase